MSALDRKLLRDLLQMKGQVITIALVVACGIASYVSIQGTYSSLLSARDTYYERQRFADVFSHAKSAPESVAAQLEAIAGVSLVETRLLEAVRFPIAGMLEPAMGHVISLPSHGRPRLGDVLLRQGRMVEPGRTGEVVVLEAFASAHGLSVGDRLPVVMAGVRRELRIVGTALSPEYIYSIAAGELIPDPRRFGVIWMDRAVVSAVFDKQGAFNDVLLRLQKGASERAVIDAVNRILGDYGGLGAYARDKQISNNVLRGELAQLTLLTRILPAIFLAVAAFLINVVLSRLVQLERAQIAVLKAVGYADRRVGLHYLKMVSVIVVFGALIGLGFGVWIGRAFAELYNRFFAFPDLRYQLDARVFVLAVAISLASAFVGALLSVRSVMRLPPAEAMRPEPPLRYRAGVLSSLRAPWLFGNATRMVLREIERRPLRAVLSSLGIALGVAVLVAGRFGGDAVDWFMEVYFDLSQREHVSVTFRRPMHERALQELAHLPGVSYAEGQRVVSVRYRLAHHARESALFGHEDAPRLRRMVDSRGQLVAPPPHGIMLSTALAKILGARLGDEIELEFLEGQRRSHRVRVTGFVDEVVALFGHMRASELARLLDDEGLVSQAFLTVDESQYGRLLRALSDRPEVLAVNRHGAMIEQFQDQTAGQMRFTTLVLTLFAGIIASGVVYNNARIALSTRSRDLASLRVLGFRRREISAILIGELFVQVAVALLPGMYLGLVIARQIMAGADAETFRFPIVISPETYAFAALVTIAAALASALVVREKLDHLDLIGVLKSRE